MNKYHLITSYCAPSPKKVWWGGIVVRQEDLADILQSIQSGYISVSHDCDYQIAGTPDATFETISDSKLFGERAVAYSLIVDQLSELLQRCEERISCLHPSSIFGAQSQYYYCDELQDLPRITQDFAFVIEKYNITHFHHLDQGYGADLYQQHFRAAPKFKEFDTSYNNGYLWSKSRDTGGCTKIHPGLIVGLTEKYIYCRRWVEADCLGLPRNIRGATRVDRIALERDGKYRHYSRDYFQCEYLLDANLTDDFVFVHIGGGYEGNFYYTNNLQDPSYLRQQEAKNQDISWARFESNQSVESWERQVLQARREAQAAHPDKQGGCAQTFISKMKTLETYKLALAKAVKNQHAQDATSRKFDL